MDLAKVNILLVDDMDVIRKITTDQLKGMGIGRVTQAEDGIQALNYLRDRTVDLIISDWEMPKMDGLMLLQKLRQNRRWANIPFIMIPADAAREQIICAIKAGVTDLMVKPFTVGMLRHRVLNALKGKTPVKADADNKTQTLTESQSILIVDDSSDNLELLGGLLKQDYRVKLVKSGEKALEVAWGEQTPDLILLDVMMPGMSGFEVLAKLRTHPQSDQIPVIFITALTQEQNKLQGLEGGAVDYITKPIQPELLKLRVKNLMNYMALHKNLQNDYDNLIEKQRLQESVEMLLNNDLKGPINGLMSIAQSLKHEHVTVKEHKHNVELLETLSQQLLQMITLSSELFKIESNRYQFAPSPFSIHAQLKQIVLLVQKTYVEKRQVIYLEPFEEEPEHQFIVEADEPLCYSMLFNLIKNACEAAPDKTQVAITLSSDTNIRVTIQNTGAVDPSIREQFWDKSVTTNPVYGAGMGTYSAKLLAQAQGIKVDMSTSDEHNSTSVKVTFNQVKI